MNDFTLVLRGCDNGGFPQVWGFNSQLSIGRMQGWVYSTQKHRSNGRMGK